MRRSTVVVLIAVSAAAAAGYLSRDRSQAVAIAAPDQQGYSELGECSATTSFDDRSVMGLHSNGYAEVSGDAGTKAGRWTFSQGQYRVTFGNETTAYKRIEVEPVACILVKGDPDSADLRSSWFARMPPPRTLGPDD